MNCDDDRQLSAGRGHGLGRGHGRGHRCVGNAIASIPAAGSDCVSGNARACNGSHFPTEHKSPIRAPTGGTGDRKSHKHARELHTL